MLDRARPQHGDDRLIRLVAGIKAAAPDRTLQQIAAQLEAMRERTPRGGTRWHPSSVKHLLARAERIGFRPGPHLANAETECAESMNIIDRVVNSSLDERARRRLLTMRQRYWRQAQDAVAIGRICACLARLTIESEWSR